jgi:spore coat polysaccharide biosynthesis protein SpsF
MVELNPVGFITVRTSSTRLPNKCLLPIGEETIISHVIKRAQGYGIEPIVCTSIHRSDDILEDIANKLGVKCFRGSLVNKLKRWLDCADYFKLEAFHTIDADDPFFDGNEMIASLDLLKSTSFDVICPTLSSSAGGASVGYSITTAIIRKSLENLDSNTDTEMMWYYLEKVDGIKMKNLPETTNINTAIRLTLDYEEDYWLLNSINRILGGNPDRDKVMQLFLDNPDMSKINMFRNDDWKAAQVSKKI